MKTKSILLIPILFVLLNACVFTTTATEISNSTINGNLETSMIDGSIARTTSFSIAASNAQPQEKAQADYVCTGKDDDAVIQAAIEAIPDTGGEIHLSSGLFTISHPIIVDKHVDIIGTGATTTRIYLANNANCEMLDYNLRNGIDNSQLIKLSGIYFNGNRDNQASGTAAINTAFGGVSNIATDAKDFLMENCWIDSYKGNGIRIVYGHNWLLTHDAIEHNDGAAIYCDNSGDGSIVACLIYSNWCGISINGESSQIRILANRIDLSSYHGIDIESNGVFNIADNVITSSSSYASGYDGIYINSCQHATIIGNYISGSAQNYGIEETGSSDYNVIVGNNIDKYTKGVITKLGSHTIVSNNLGYITDNKGSATIAAGQTSVTVNHKLSATPNVVMLTPTDSTTGLSYYVSSVTPTQFIIKISTKRSSDLKIYWQASL